MEDRLRRGVRLRGTVAVWSPACLLGARYYSLSPDSTAASEKATPRVRQSLEAMHMIRVAIVTGSARPNRNNEAGEIGFSGWRFQVPSVRNALENAGRPSPAGREAEEGRRELILARSRYGYSANGAGSQE